jgi:hypothetical protein
LQQLRSAGKSVVVFGDTPSFDIDPIWRMRTRDIPVRWHLAQRIMGGQADLDPGVDRAVDDTPPQKSGELVLEQTAASVPGVTFWNTRDHLCSTNDLCIYRQDQTPLFVDTNHISPAGAVQVLEGWKLPDGTGEQGTASGSNRSPRPSAGHLAHARKP